MIGSNYENRRFKYRICILLLSNIILKTESTLDSFLDSGRMRFFFQIQPNRPKRTENDQFPSTEHPINHLRLYIEPLTVAYRQYDFESVVGFKDFCSKVLKSQQKSLEHTVFAGTRLKRGLTSAKKSVPQSRDYKQIVRFLKI